MYKNKCNFCNEKRIGELYPIGYTYYDNNGGMCNIGKEKAICSICLELLDKEE